MQESWRKIGLSKEINPLFDLFFIVPTLCCKDPFFVCELHLLVQNCTLNSIKPTAFHDFLGNTMPCRCGKTLSLKHHQTGIIQYQLTSTIKNVVLALIILVNFNANLTVMIIIDTGCPNAQFKFRDLSHALLLTPGLPESQLKIYR